MILVVWIAEQDADNQCYNLIARTKKELVEKINSHWDKGRFSEPKKVVINYKDGFDLFDLVTNEGGGRHSSY